MKDIQSQQDHRQINIKKVGVKDISYPITVLDKSQQLQQTVANVNMYVNLPHHFKGTHMSRFVEILNRFHGNINLESFHVILEEMKEKLQAEAAHMEIRFPYFLKKKKPSPNTIGIGQYVCTMHGSLEKVDDLTLDVQIPISPPTPPQSNNVLPRSLGNWGFANISLRFRNFIWIEDIIEMAEEVTSHDLCLLADESPGKGNFLSVEKIAHSLGQKLSEHPHIRWFSVTVENLSEGFNTFASLEWPENKSSIN